MAYEINPVLDRLCAAFPACFSRTAPQPLKISLGDEVLALADLSRTQVRRALKVYTGSPAYRKALARGGPRYDLAGQPAGEVTPDQQANARMPRARQLPVSPAAPPLSPATGYLPMTLKRRL